MLRRETITVLGKQYPSINREGWSMKFKFSPYLGFALLTISVASNVYASGGQHSSNEIGSGYWLESNCPSDTSDIAKPGAGMCMGYVLGVLAGEKMGQRLGAAVVLTSLSSKIDKHESRRLWKNVYGMKQFCIPQGVTNGQIAFVVSKYLRNHPEDLQKNTVDLVFGAMESAWPCKKSN